MNEEQVIEIVNRSLVDEFELDADKLTPEAHLIDDLGFDSLDFVDLVVVLQKAFNVKLREEPRVREVRTLGDIYALVMMKQQEMAAEQGA